MKFSSKKLSELCKHAVNEKQNSLKSSTKQNLKIFPRHHIKF